MLARIPFENSALAKTRPGAVAAAAVLPVAFCAYLLPFLIPDQIGSAYITLHAALTLFMLIAWASPSTNMKIVFLIGISARLALIPLDPITSNDSERYLWDGAVALSGLDPYIIAPDDLKARQLRAVWPTPPEHGAYPTIYPPASLLLFSLAAIAGPYYSFFVWKVFTAIASILALWLTRETLTRHKLGQALPLFAFSPLLLLETGIGAHLDIFLVLGICMAIWAIDRNRLYFAGCALGASAAVKFIPIVLLLPMMWGRPLKEQALLCAGGISAIGLFYGSALAIGLRPLGNLFVFFEKWRFGSPVFSSINTVFDPATTTIILGLLAAAMTASAFWRMVKKDFWTASVLLLAIPLTLSPVVFPWYLSVLVPFFVLKPNATLFAWITIAPSTYVVLNRWLSPERVFEEATWPLFAIVAAVTMGAIFDLVKSRRNSGDERSDIAPTSGMA